LPLPAAPGEPAPGPSPQYGESAGRPPVEPVNARVRGRAARCLCWRLTFAVWFAGTAAAAIAATGQSSPTVRTSLRGIAFDERLDDGAALLAALPEATTALPPLIARISFDLAATPPDRFAEAVAELDRRLSVYGDRKVSVMLRLGEFPDRDDRVEAWRQSLRTVVEHAAGKVIAYQIGAVTAAARPVLDRYLFLLKLASVQVRAVDGSALVIEGPVPVSFDDWQSSLYAEGVAPYLDGLAIAATSSAAADDVASTNLDRLTAVVDRADPAAVVMLDSVALPDGANAASLFFRSEVRALASGVRVASYSGGPGAIRSALSVAARIADLLSGVVVTLDDRSLSLRLSDGGADVTGRVPHFLLFNTSSFANFLVYGGIANSKSVDVGVTLSGSITPEVRDPLTGAVVKPARIEQAPGRDGTRFSFSVPAAQYPLVLDFNAGATDRFTESADVRKVALPSVAEIIARHQQVQAVQDAALQRYTAHMRLEQHFHPSAAEPAWNIVTENRLFFERGVIEWEEMSFELNGATWTSNRPPFPLVQPEKVLSLPLELRLSRDYRYRLDGVEQVEGRPAYVVRFEPIDNRQALYRGTVWIDRESYVRLKLQAVQSNLKGVVVSNDETQTFSPVGELQGRPIWLMDRLSSKQMFLIAGRTVLVEREARLTDVSLNPGEFEAERTAARAGNRIMYRDTDQGLRYLVKRGETRVVSNELTTSTKALAFGVQVDPSFDYPLPLGGLDVLDFDFLNRNMQFALLFAGVFGAGNIQRPNLWNGRFDASVDFFWLAVKSNDSLFDAHGELLGERVQHLPASTGVNLGFQATPFQKLIAHYELRYDAYSRAPGTAADFEPPSSTLTHGVGASYEYRRRGYSFTANVMQHYRTAATLWGPPGALELAPASYTTYDAGVSKDFIFRTFHTIHVNAQYFGGDRIDRFSTYQFGFFDPARMHGVPTAVRFGELAMFRGSYSFNIFDQYRIDLFADHARGRWTVLSDSWQPVTGLGLGLNLRTPHNTILRLDLGRSFLPDLYRGAGSTVLQVMLLKPL
jgi:hypothetical protein